MLERLQPAPDLQAANERLRKQLAEAQAALPDTLGPETGFTLVTITGSFSDPDSGPCQGSVTAELSRPLTNGGEGVSTNPVRGQLDSEGKLVAYPLTSSTAEPFQLVANNDTGTEPEGTHYRFTINLDNAPVRSFFASVSQTAPGHTVDLSELEP